MDTLSETKLAAKVAADESEKALAASNARIAELEAKLATAREQVNVAGGDGVPAHMLTDYKRRRQLGLNHKQAVDCCWEQWEQDKKTEADRVAAEEAKAAAAAAKAPKVAAPVIAPAPAPVEEISPTPKAHAPVHTAKGTHK